MNAHKSHQDIAKEMDLFVTVEEAPGMPFFLPNGMVIRNELEQFWKDLHAKNGYEEVKTPLLLKQHLWEQSGHWAHYKDNMYFSEVDGQAYAIKPMSCPGALLIYNQKRRSSSDLPIRYAELGHVHRYEKSGSLNGLLRVRSITQDDAHIFVHKNQIEAELIRILDLVHQVYKTFGFDYRVELSTKPEKAMGDANQWDHAEAVLKSVLDKQRIPYVINEGDGAFYGPKIDFHITDSRSRSWQCGTIQLDFQMPEKFGCLFSNDQQQLEHPILIHRAIYGSVERFMAILIEHYEGRFPFWLAPVQVEILPIHESQHEYGATVLTRLKENGIRVRLNVKKQSFGAKIRASRMNKTPYRIIIGKEEMDQQKVTLQDRDGEQRSLPLEDLLPALRQE
ncbi:threonine--tRNA ligase [Shouchella sp. JSM 1781072]|uniref:threonine--tRNA ligase n=1 Tax=Bacillaceae TaxID=186817 RepID=UPI000C08B480|nr:threonine--tRNA ligase [Bacillus sp. Marseille-P3800]